MLPTTLDASLTLLLSDRVEGRYSNRPPGADPGGETMYGITRKTALRHGYTGDMRFLPRQTAEAIYLIDYWRPNKTEEMPSCLRYALFDASVNSGPNQAAQWLQRALDIEEDGIVGPHTLRSAKAAPNPTEICAAMVGYRLDFMTSLPIWGANSRGWARRISLILTLLGASK